MRQMFQPVLVAAVLALSGAGVQAKQKVCVFDILGANGDAFNTAKDYALEMQRHGADLELKVYIDERVAVEDYRTGQCDAVMATALRTRAFNPLTAALDSVGASTIVKDGRLDMAASEEVVRRAIQTYASPKAAHLMVQGGHEVGGIVPMGAAIWSMSLADMLDFPLQFFVRFFKNHGLLSVSDRPQWCVVEGGSSSYVAPLTESFKQHIRLNCPVTRVERDGDGVTLHSAAGTERFDKVIFACHSDQALALLAEPTRIEKEILGALPYADNDVVLHTDTRLLPKRPLAWASWNYRLGGPASQPAAVTYDMNILQGIQSDTTFCVSLNQTAAIDPSKILARYTYAHPQYSLAGMAAQARWEELLGANHSYFCGAYWANGFHEDGVVSALRVAREFGEAL